MARVEDVRLGVSATADGNLNRFWSFRLALQQLLEKLCQGGWHSTQYIHYNCRKISFIFQVVLIIISLLLYSYRYNITFSNSLMLRLLVVIK